MEVDPTGAVCAVVAALVTGTLAYKSGQRATVKLESEPLGPAVLTEDVMKMCRAHLACRNKGKVFGPKGEPRLCPKAKVKFMAKHARDVVEHEGALYWRVKPA